jgi:CYTH domain-containing protein
MSLLTYKDARRENKRNLSKVRSRVSEVPLTDPCILLPNKKVEGVANEVDEFVAVNWASKRAPSFLLVEQDDKLAKDLKAVYDQWQIPVFHSKLSAFTKQYAGKISYMHADYCSTVNKEADQVIQNLRGKLASQGAVLRFTHARRQNYLPFHLQDSKNLMKWLINLDAISEKAAHNLDYQAHTFQTDPTLRVGIQLIANHVMNTNTLGDPAQISINRSNNYEIVDCVSDKYRDTGANMQTMRFVLKPCMTVDPRCVINSLYTVYNALQ